ncbi:hypothetical protein X766_16080 [Mesorhizobium sp. LSJC255A00]|nr:hypothetical protein X766_16080 [Mesorhizobium sp. LSJC255A00]
MFVFGSNTAGRHGKGAALTALRHHGAIYGQSTGLMGNAYALPTCDAGFRSLPLQIIRHEVQHFIAFARSRKDLGFQVTRVGCGLAYNTDDQIAPMFKEAPALNVFFDEKWRPFLGNGYDYWGTF